MSNIRYHRNGDQGTKKIREYMVELHGGSFWQWKIDQMDDEELVEAYEEHLRAEKAAKTNSKETK